MQLKLDFFFVDKIERQGTKRLKPSQLLFESTAEFTSRFLKDINNPLSQKATKKGHTEFIQNHVRQGY